tara:strand:- start:1549 stop:4497 length:2949 start_codon:yes stop_codon:yes gene_type:complete
MNQQEERVYNKAVIDLNEERRNDDSLVFTIADFREVIEDILNNRRRKIEREKVNQEVVCAELEKFFNITIGEQGILVDYDHYKEWVTDQTLEFIKSGKQLSQWIAYTKLLRQDGLPNEVIQSIDKSTTQILNGMANPNQEDGFEKKGLVLGYVQSGKTSNYIGLINKSIDFGYKFIIVLAGIHNNLRLQTQERLDATVTGNKRKNGKNSNVGVRKENFLNSKRVLQITSQDPGGIGDFNRHSLVNNPIDLGGDDTIIAVVKKNKHVLTNINAWLNDYLDNNNLKTLDKPLLLIDDECDQASVDSRFDPNNYNKPTDPSDPESSPSIINGLVNEILNKFSKRSYVGYTATPFANLFIPINDPNYSNLFPEHFIVKLAQPSNYHGPHKYFDISKDEEDSTDEVLFVNDLDKLFDQFKEKEEEPEDYDIEDNQPNQKIRPVELNNSLKTAIYSFIISGAIRYFRGQDKKHMSMLVHTSRLKLDQARIYLGIQKFIGKIKENSDQFYSDLEAIYKGKSNDFGVTHFPKQKDITVNYGEVTKDIISEDQLPNSIYELKTQIDLFISELKLKLINSLSSLNQEPVDSNLNYEDYRDSGLKVIAVGGNTLSRGLTLEGLHTSYFVRRAGNYDTLMQMGRWFGYRPGYGDLCKVFTTAEIFEDFKTIVEAEELMRLDMDTLIRDRVQPRDFVIRIKNNSATMRVTGKMGIAGSRRVSWKGGETITSVISKNTEVIKSNWEKLSKILKTIQFDGDSLPHKSCVSLDKLSISEFPNLQVINSKGDLDIEAILEYYKLCGYKEVDFCIVTRNYQKENNGFTENFNFNKINTSLSVRGLPNRNSATPYNKKRENELIELSPDHFKVIKGKLTDSNHLSKFLPENHKINKDKLSDISMVCSRLKRPVITIVPFNPNLFFKTHTFAKSKDLESSYELTVDHIDTTKVENLKLGGEINWLPFGISFATPGKGASGEDLKDESIYVNMAIQNLLKERY